MSSELFYPRTIIDVVDNSQAPEVPIVPRSNPLYLTSFAAPKGTEDLVIVQGDDFYTKYITSGERVNFSKYGQALLQAEAAINAGATLLAKRVVADDATLANLAVVAKVTTKQVQKLDANGKPVFKDPDTNKEVDAHGVFAAINVLHPTEKKVEVSKKIANTTIVKKSNTVEPAKKVMSPEVKQADETSTIKPGSGVLPKTTEPAKVDSADKTVTPATGTGTTPAKPVVKPVEPATKPAVITPAAKTDGKTDGGNAVVKPLEPVMETVVVVTFECNTTTGAFNIGNITNGIYSLLDNAGTNGTFTYPLFILSDVGRGVSEKKIKIVPNYQESKITDSMVYNLVVIENNTAIETLPFNLNTNNIINGMNTSIETIVQNMSEQLKCKQFADCIDMFIGKVAELGKIEVSEADNLDLLFGKDILNPSINLTGYEVDLDNGINLQHVYGIELDSGTNGVFGDAPIGTVAYEQELLDFYSGKYTTDIYDLDNYKIDLLVDCDYPAKVKRAIEALADFRGDFEYIEDLGTGLYTLDAIISNANEAATSRNVSLYYQSYDILDPHTKKQINVTVGYSIAKLMVNHFLNGRNRPFAGELYNIILRDAVPGTVNYIPKVTPNLDEKAILYEARINYGSYYDGKFVLETILTNQVKPTQLSYSNNMLSLQQIVKAVRSECPKNRYSFITGKDLERYKADVQRVLNKYAGNFASLEMKYVQNPTMTQNKVFSAAIEVTFKDFVQTEYFTIYALN